MHYTCLDLNEINVQAIFNRCLARPDSQETTGSVLFWRAFGYEKEDTGVSFDKAKILSNQKNILYLFGQLYMIQTKEDVFKIPSFCKKYDGNDWTNSKTSILQLLYLGSSEGFRIIMPLMAKQDGTKLLCHVPVTLSPKDPAFPAWWEAHKAEWEQ